MSPNEVVTIRISQVEPNRAQPRKEFDEEKIASLADSIRQFGVIQPLLVQKRDGYYEIVAGERRWRAAKMAGLRTVPVIIREYTKQQAAEISLIENIQREDLNPVEEARAYKRLMEEFALTQEAVAERVAKSRVAVTNAMRLLKLPDSILEMLSAGDLSGGHARTLLSLENEEEQLAAARMIIKEGLSVRDAEKLVKKMHMPPRVKAVPDAQLALAADEFSAQLSEALGTRVRVLPKTGGKGKIEVEYYSSDDFDRIAELLRGSGRGGEARS